MGYNPYESGLLPQKQTARKTDLRELEVDSVPVNFLDPRPGTPLGEIVAYLRDAVAALDRG